MMNSPEIFAFIGCALVGALVTALVQRAFGPRESAGVQPPPAPPAEPQQPVCAAYVIEHGSMLAVIASKVEELMKRFDLFEKEGFGRMRRLEDKVAAHGALIGARHAHAPDPDTDTYSLDELRRHG